MKRSYFLYIFVAITSIFAVSGAGLAQATPPDPFPGTTLSVTSSPSYPSGAPLNTSVTYTVHVNFTSTAWSNSNGNGVSQGGKCVWVIKNSTGGTINQTYTNPTKQTDCDMSFSDKFTSSNSVATYQVTISNSWSQSIALSGSVKPQASSNIAPQAIAQFSINGAAPDTMVTVPLGVPVHVVIDASRSKDADGWTTPGTGVSQGGKCYVNKDFFSNNQFPYATVIDNPASPSACNVDAGMITFSKYANGTTSHTYNVLRIDDAAGAHSYIASATVTVIDSHQPVANVKISINGAPAATNVTVPAGVPVHVTLDASGSSDPDGWTTADIGVSKGGQCAWNTNVETTTPVNLDKVISNPGSPSACSVDLGMHTFQVQSGVNQDARNLLRITDASGDVSAYGVAYITVVNSPANRPPVAAAKVSINGSVPSASAVVPRGTAVHVVINGSSSTDPDGWTTATTGVSQGGKCELNTTLSKSIPTSYAKTIANPATAATCAADLGMLTFNDTPGTYTYNELRITDASGAVSNIAPVTITVVDASSNAPVAIAQVSGDNGPFAAEVWVARATPTHIQLSASQSSDPDGWSSEKCEWNTDLNRGVITYEKTITNPINPAACNVDLGMKTFNDAPGRYIYPVLRITDGAGNVSNIASITVVVLSGDPANVPPIAVAQFIENGGAPSPHIYVSRGVPVRISLDASASSDPNGWTTPNTGVSSGGSCQWNTNLDQSNPTPFQKIISNPSTPSACNVDLGTLVFNDPPGTYTYTLLRIIDASGAISPIAFNNHAASFIAKLLGNTAQAQSSDGTALVTVVDGPTPTPSPTCNPFGYNPDCPPPTPTPTPSVSPTPTVTVAPTDTPSPSPSPSESPSPTPPPCDPLDVACIVTSIGGGDAGSALAATITNQITDAIARLIGLQPGAIQAFVKEKGASLAAALAAAAAALSAPFLAANILPSVAQWGQFFGSIFTVHRRKDRWGIVVDSDLGKPIANAVVQVFDAKFNQLKETQITGADGQFGFLLPAGKYYIIASEAGFAFPPHKRPPVQLRENERIYLGEEFTITEQDPEKIPHIVVPMDREEKVPAGAAILRRYWERLLAFVDNVGFAFLFVGAGINTYLLLLAPATLNIIFEALYLILFGLKLYIMLSHQKGIGTVIDRASRKPTDLAIIRLYNAKTNRIIQTRVTNSIGRFFLLVPRGEYTVSVSKQGYKTLLIDKVQIKGRSSKALALDFSLEPQTV